MEGNMPHAAAVEWMKTRNDKLAVMPGSITDLLTKIADAAAKQIAAEPPKTEAGLNLEKALDEFAAHITANRQSYEGKYF